MTDTEKETWRERREARMCVYVRVCVCMRARVSVCVVEREVPQAKPRVKMAGPENSLLLGKQDKTTSPNV